MRLLTVLALLPLIGAPPQLDPNPPVLHDSAPAAIERVGTRGMSAGQPDNCTEACYRLLDDNGDTRGYGCMRGTQGRNCIASVYTCTISQECIIIGLITESGATVAMGPRCQIFSPTAPAYLGSRGVPAIGEEAM